LGHSQQNRQDGHNDRNEKANEATDGYAFVTYDEDCVNDGCKVS